MRSRLTNNGVNDRVEAVFEKAAASVGNEYRCSKVWDIYLQVRCT